MRQNMALAALVACCLAGCSQPIDSTHAPAVVGSTSAESTAQEEKEPAPSDDLLAPQDGEPAPSDDLPAPQDGEPEAPQESQGFFASSQDVVLTPTDDYGKGYVFAYGDDEFVAYFDTYSWRVYDSYKITNHADIVAICQALQNLHTVYGSDWETPRTAEDMAYEWEQHNLVYNYLPEGSEWLDDVKDVDLDPQDQGKSFQQMYEDRTGRPLDISDFV